MENSVDPLPERQLCEYEKLREDIIRERREAMANCGFFENLLETKVDIGLYAKNDAKKKGLSEKHEKIEKPSKYKNKPKEVNKRILKHADNKNVEEEIDKKSEDKLLIVNEKGTKLDEKTGNSVSNLYENRFIGDELYYFEME